MKPREFWISELPKDYGNQVYCLRRAARGYIHVREVTGPDYKAIAEELMRALEKATTQWCIKPECKCWLCVALASAKKRME